MKRIYMDHAATTAMHEDVKAVMLSYLDDMFGNASSLHSFGQETAAARETARAHVAALIAARPEEITFTAGGTESDNLAIHGIALALESRGKHIITSAIEHHAVLHTCDFLRTRGWDITTLPVDGYGFVDPDDVRKAIRPGTVLVSIMHANNEIGTIEPVAEIGAITREADICFHCDAVQSAGAIKVDVDAMNIDLLSMSAHKLYGPKGIGALYVRRGTRITPILHGGGQERNRRPGTENIPAIAGFGKAAELALAHRDCRADRLIPMRDRLIEGLTSSLPEIILNGHPTTRLPNNVSICARYVEGESMLLALDMEGIAASTGSACSSGTLDPSHVLTAIGRPHEDTHGSLRLTPGRINTPGEVERVIEVFPSIVRRFRDMSPVTPAHLRS